MKKVISLFLSLCMMLSLLCCTSVYAEDKQIIYFADLYSQAFSENHSLIGSAAPGERVSFGLGIHILNLDETKYSTQRFIIKDYNTKEELARVTNDEFYTMPSVPILVSAEIKDKTDTSVKLYTLIDNRSGNEKLFALMRSDYAVYPGTPVDEDYLPPMDFNNDGKNDVIFTGHGKMESDNYYVTAKLTSAGAKLAGKTYTADLTGDYSSPFCPYKSIKVSIVKSSISLSLKKVRVRRSAKKLTLTARLKLNKKTYKNKKVTFYFGKKKYTAKTNSKGYAKVTIKKSVLRKLKKGKKITYKVKFSTKTVKRTATVLK